MSLSRTVGAVALVSLFASTSLVAQDRGIVISGQAGGYSPTLDLNADAGEFDTGFSLGAGLGLVLTKNIAIRSNFTFARTDIDGVLGLEGTDINRYYYGGDIQVRFPIASFAPYVFGGAGGVTVNESGDGPLDSFTKPAARFGLGINYRLPVPGLQLFSEGTGWVYDFDRSDMNLNGTQFDIGWTGGLSYTLPF